MNYFKFQKLIKDLKNKTLSKSEQFELKQEFLKEINFPFKEPVFYFKTTMIVIPACILLFVIVPLTYAAEISKPGDTLYPVKEVINEPVKRVLNKVIGKDQVDFEIELLDKKIEQSEKTFEKEKEKISDSKKEKVKKAIDIQIKKTEKVIQKEQKKIEIKEKIEEVKDIKKEKVEEIKEDVLEKKEEVKETIESKKEEKLKNVLEKHNEVLEKLDLPTNPSSFLGI